MNFNEKLVLGLVAVVAAFSLVFLLTPASSVEGQLTYPSSVDKAHKAVKHAPLALKNCKCSVDGNEVWYCEKGDRTFVQSISFGRGESLPYATSKSSLNACFRHCTEVSWPNSRQQADLDEFRKARERNNARMSEICTKDGRSVIRVLSTHNGRGLSQRI